MTGNLFSWNVFLDRHLILDSIADSGTIVITTKTICTGLGLANVKQIATAHQGGRVEVKDIHPHGTAFEVLLPLIYDGSCAARAAQVIRCADSGST